MKYFLSALLCIFLLCTENIQAQGQANNWYFGNNAGLNFNGGAPLALTDGQLNTSEGCSAISDSSGQLLFYTDGATVWNRNHDTLFNGFGLLGELSSTQAALIIPKPGSNNIYYIFTTSQAQRLANWNFCYTEVDMSLDGGLGGVTANKNIILFQPIGEKITAVKHSNNIDIWVITHAKNTNAYLTYAVTSSGVNTTPIIFNGGTIDNGVGDGYPSPNWGYMKASPDGSKIAAAFSVVNKTDVLDFNNTNGQLSLQFTINQIVGPYGVEFSPNSSLLYVSSFSSQLIRQYNLALATPAAIISSSYSLTNFNGNNANGLQLGPDEKIYTVSGDFLGAISNPNQLGIACNFISNAVSLNGRSASLGLPNFFPYFLIPSGIEHVGSCPNDSIFFTFLNGAQVDSVLWNFDDPNSGISNTSTSLSPFHIYQNAGTYIVSVTTYQGSVTNTVTKPVTILPIPDISIGDDITFCTGSSGGFFISNAQNGFTYNWSVQYDQFPLINFVHPHTSLSVVNTGIYYVSATNICGVSLDTANAIRVDPITDFTLGPDITICEGNQIYLSTANQQIADYLWQDGSTASFLFVTQGGSYTLQQSNSCGIVSDTILLTVLPLPVLSFVTDTIFCNGDTLQITPTGIFDEFVWQSGVLNEPLVITETGFYIAYASTVCGLTYDTITAIKISAPVEFNFADSLSFCEGSSLTLDVTQADVAYVWQDGSTNAEFTVTQAGTYTVLINNQCGVATDTAFVIENPLPTVSLGADTTFCLGDSIQLNAVGLANTYLWQDGSNDAFFITSTSGTYSVFATNSCGVTADTIQVATLAPPLAINLGSDTAICIGTQLLLNAGQNNVVYQWQDGSSNPQFTAAQTGTYAVLVSNICGVAKDSLLLTVNPLPSVSLGPDIVNCNGNAIQLNAVGIADAYLWQDGSNLQTLTTNISGNYFVIVSNSCGTSSDTIAVRLGLTNSSFINRNECGAFSLNGILYSTSGQFTQVLQNAVGCDSIITINASITDINAQIVETDSTLFLNINPTAIQWINCDTKALIVGATQASFVPQFTGSYAAIAISGLCLDTSNCIKITRALPEEVPSLLCQGLIIYPNPIYENIEFKYDKAYYPINIFTSTGALLKSFYGNQQKQTIFLENLAPAMYILQVDECRFKIVKN